VASYYRVVFYEGKEMEGEKPRVFPERSFLTQRQKDKVFNVLVSLSEEPGPPGSRQVGSHPESVSSVFSFTPREGRELFISIDEVCYLYVLYAVHHEDKIVMIYKIVPRRGPAPAGALDFS